MINITLLVMKHYFTALYIHELTVARLYLRQKLLAMATDFDSSLSVKVIPNVLTH